MFAFSQIQPRTAGITSTVDVGLGKYLEASADQGFNDNLFGVVGRFTEDRIYKEGPIVAPSVLNRMYGIEGRLTFTEPEYTKIAELRHDRKRREMEREYYLSEGSKGFFSGRGAAGLGAGLVTSMLNPLDLGLAFMPVTGSLARAKQLESVGAGAIRQGFARGLVTEEAMLASKIPAPRFFSAMIDGTVSQAGIEIPLAYQNMQDQANYGPENFFTNIALGGAFSGGINLAGNAIARAFRKIQNASPETREAMFRQALQQTMRDESVNVASYVQLDEGRIAQESAVIARKLAEEQADASLPGFKETLFKERGEKITAAALRDPKTGEVFQGPTHFMTEAPIHRDPALDFSPGARIAAESFTVAEMQAALPGLKDRFAKWKVKGATPEEKLAGLNTKQKLAQRIQSLEEAVKLKGIVGKEHIKYDEGFVTDAGKFVSREEAAKIAGIKHALASEDLGLGPTETWARDERIRDYEKFGYSKEQAEEFADRDISGAKNRVEQGLVDGFLSRPDIQDLIAKERDARIQQYLDEQSPRVLEQQRQAEIQRQIAEGRVMPPEQTAKWTFESPDRAKSAIDEEITLLEKDLKDKLTEEDEAEIAGAQNDIVDTITGALEKLKIKQGGGMRMGLHDIPAAVWNGAIDAVIGAIKAGKAVKDAIEEGIKHLSSRPAEKLPGQEQYQAELNQWRKDVLAKLKSAGNEQIVHLSSAPAEKIAREGLINEGNFFAVRDVWQGSDDLSEATVSVEKVIDRLFPDPENYTGENFIHWREASKDPALMKQVFDEIAEEGSLGDGLFVIPGRLAPEDFFTVKDLATGKEYPLDKSPKVESEFRKQLQEVFKKSGPHFEEGDLQAGMGLQLVAELRSPAPFGKKLNPDGTINVDLLRAEIKKLPKGEQELIIPSKITGDLSGKVDPKWLAGKLNEQAVIDKTVKKSNLSGEQQMLLNNLQSNIHLLDTWGWHVDNSGRLKKPGSDLTYDRDNPNVPARVWETVNLINARRKELGGLDEVSQATHWASFASKSPEFLKEHDYFELAVTAKGQVLFESSHGFPENTLGFTRGWYASGKEMSEWNRGKMNLPDDAKVLVLEEVQSDWARARRDTEGAPDDVADALGGKDHPLLADYNRLMIKAAMAEGRENGATHIVIVDAETAMMSEGHDIRPANHDLYENSEFIEFLSERTGYSEQELFNMMEEEFNGLRLEATKLENEFLENWSPSQEGGMRFNYDPNFTDKSGKVIGGQLHRIASEIGGAGTDVRMGVHDKALDSDARLALRQGAPNTERELIDEYEYSGDKDRLREDLYFRDGEDPRFTGGGRLYPIPDRDFTIAGKDRPVKPEKVQQARVEKMLEEIKQKLPPRRKLDPVKLPGQEQYQEALDKFREKVLAENKYLYHGTAADLESINKGGLDRETNYLAADAGWDMGPGQVKVKTADVIDRLYPDIEGLMDHPEIDKIIDEKGTYSHADVRKNPKLMGAAIISALTDYDAGTGHGNYVVEGPIFRESIHSMELDQRPFVSKVDQMENEIKRAEEPHVKVEALKQAADCIIRNAT